MICAVENCGRAVAYPGHRYCSTCVAVVLRTGQEPVLPVFVPAWRKRLTAKDLTRSAA
jgi:hypothetical protein